MPIISRHLMTCSDIKRSAIYFYPYHYYGPLILLVHQSLHKLKCYVQVLNHCSWPN